MRRADIVYALIVVWALAIGWSLWGAAAVEGPRNLDTGFKKLDVFFKGQLLAFGVALVTAAAGFAFAGAARRIRLIGLIPIGLTVLVLAGSTAAFLLFNEADPTPSTQTRMPTAPADGAVD
ncbi:hypothetical protein [Hoeflea prorocentri]|uniref:Uncharacterized protein n=1 Tax=Hoeflea prorocentri TaxID=1922333 RepID=A0A9X3ULB8_9HYPH|nr:hypothetical protein [Hoeflea prorocentri]MCY6383357.1 hypothetical protein [Hoeflea prorocentri]MDA5401157.1 hypothetical protein [Hoeflea prorocentri]